MAKMEGDRETLERKVQQATELLESIGQDYGSLAELSQEVRKRFLIAAGRIARPGPWDRKALADAALARRKAKKKQHDEDLLDQTGIRQSRRQPVFSPWTHGGTVDAEGRNVRHDVEPPRAKLKSALTCYICKGAFDKLHFFYDSLCPSCAELNWAKRTPKADLHDRVALLTGARVKIGYQAALMLLRAGCRVVVTTRFARDAAKRYAAERDFSDWSDRLEILSLDLRHTPSVEAFCRFLSGHLPRLDFIINNACQTVRRPSGFYDHLMVGESEPREMLAAELRRVLPDPSLPELAVGLTKAAQLSQLQLHAEDGDSHPSIFPAGQLDADLQQVDLREINSWRLGLADVSAIELLEVQLVNSVAPFILNARLKALMTRSATRDKQIVNVSAVEGQFSRRFKTDKHPHTNMAKAALNMMTRTSAADYLRDGIHMNSVDTGWVTDEDPVAIAERKTREQGFHPPLDIVDGAARIVDPIFEGVGRGVHVWGAFLKDYQVVDW